MYQTRVSKRTSHEAKRSVLRTEAMPGNFICGRSFPSFFKMCVCMPGAVERDRRK